MSKRMTIDDLLSRCYNTLEEARKAVASLPRTDPDRHIYFYGEIGNQTVYVRASDEERAKITAAVWKGEGSDLFKIRPDACPGCGQSFDGMVGTLRRGGLAFEKGRKLEEEAEAFLLANLAAEEVPVAC